MKAALLSLLLGFSAAFSAFANEITDNITVVGGTVEEQGNDVVITFTAEKIAEDGAGTLSFKAGQATASVLAVGGGGGGGGTLSKTATHWGAGGGGGAGGFVEAAGLTFKGSYVISVGKGGSGVAVNTHAEGGDGHPTTITQGGTQVPGIAVAKGGGGGGAGGSQWSATQQTSLYSGEGRPGASGGGASQTYRSSSRCFTNTGGKATQGNPGGDTTVDNVSYWIGAGGGGAGGAGTSVSSSNQSGGAPGGDGKTSTITGSLKTYASGGAGGAINKSGIGKVAKKDGGGGSGGTSANTESRNGTPGTGGGGGGASGGGTDTPMPSGEGGSGVLIIRLSNFIAGGVRLPEIPAFVYDGNVKTAAVDTTYYTVSNESQGTDARSYTVTLTLTEAGRALRWDDTKGTEVRNLGWSIDKKPIAKPVTKEKGYVYTGSEQVGYTNGTWYTVEEAKRKATDAATYAPYAELVDPSNTKWADGSANPRTDLSWTIDRLKVAAPVPSAASWTYTGSEQIGYTNGTWYTVEEAKRKATNAGTYAPTASLNSPGNTEWADGSADPRTDLSWTIASCEVTKPIAASGLVFNGEEQTGANAEALAATEYTLSGHRQTNAGDYQFVAHLNNPEGVANYKWKFGDAADLSVKWSIAQKSVDYPQTKGSVPTYKYDGEVKTPFPKSSWYEVADGTASETKAGKYSCTLHLTYNDKVTNVIWSDGTSDDATWNWEITARVVAIPAGTTFVYAEEPRGTAVVRTMLTVPDDANLNVAVSSELEQSQAGIYIYELSLKDPGNTVWSDGTTDTQDVECKIEKAENEIQNLRMNDWQAGSSESAPSAGVKFGPATSITYSYGDSATGPWGATKLTANGYHYVRASAPEGKNWKATEAVRRYCVWTHPSEVFSDYVDITMSGYKGSSPLVDFPVLVRIREAVKDDSGAVTNGFPGFAYARAGKNGADIRFLYDGDKPEKTDDQLLSFEVEKWDVTGESLVWVKVPKLQGKTTKFRLYWHTNDPKSANDPTLVWSAYKKGSSECEISKAADFFTYGLVNVDGIWVDYWTRRPSLKDNRKQWDEDTITEADVDKGALKRNSVAYCYVTMPGEQLTNTVVQTKAGTYRVICDIPPEASETYTLFEGPAVLEYTVVGISPDIPVGDTTDGRILLANNDTLPDHVVTGQGYWDTDPSKPTFWWHDAATPNVYMKNLRTGSNHILYHRVSSEETNVLWRVKYGWMGNWYYNAGGADSGRNYLPVSRTAEPLADPAVKVSMTNVTHLVFHNTPDAAVYSPCYTNGIGTIYFDAVNAEAADTEAELVVEVATRTTRDAPLDVPTDENCKAADDPDPFFYLTHDKDGAPLLETDDMWQPIAAPCVMIKQKGSSELDRVASQPTDGRIKLSVKNGGESDVFYRIAAQVAYTNAVRFRIKRTKKSASGIDDESRTRFILVDNIFVSKPPKGANLSAPGEYDPDLKGKQVLGQACALDRPFPAWTESGIRGRAKIEYVTNGEDIDTSTFVASARLNYRWRYLNQAFEPAKLNGKDQWTTLYLDHNAIKGGLLTTVKPLEFPRAAGDIEWFYDLVLQSPVSRYVDYSGGGIDPKKPIGDYDEAPRAVTNHMTVASTDRLASAGRDWFVRLREGKSDWQGMQVVIEAGEGAKNLGKLVGTHDMEIVDDNMWRRFVNIPTNAEGTCTFRFRAINRQTGSPTAIAENSKIYGLSAEGQSAAIPTSGTMVENGHAVKFTIDHAANYLEFKMSDRYQTFQVGRAEYQDFNFWNDAKKGTDQFCIDSSDTNSVNVADMQKESASFGEWPQFTATNSVWNEWFTVADYEPTDGRFIKNIFHQSTHETPNAASWCAQNITFVSEKFVTAAAQKKDSGMAGKLLGNGSGLMDFSNIAAPQGIEKIDLNVRIGQSDVFDAFACCDRSYGDDNYTLFVPVTMSHATKADGTEAGDMAVGASISLVGYHKDKVGCYEVRCERLYSGETIRLSLWKWTYKDQKYSSTRLAYRDFGQTCWSWERNTTSGAPIAENERKFYGMFVSFETTYGSGGDEATEQTKIVCGLSNAQVIGIGGVAEPWKKFSYEKDVRADVRWRGLVYTETKDKSPHGWGRYGMTSKDCPAQMVMPAHRMAPYDTTRIVALKDNVVDDKSQGGQYFEDEKLVIDDGLPPAYVDDRDDLNKRRIWTTNPGRTECFTNVAAKTYRWIGLHAPTDVEQTLELYLKKRNTDESQWKQVSKPVTVKGYGFTAASFDVKTAGEWDVRLRTGADKAIDVVVDKITQYQWQADSYPYYNASTHTGRYPEEDEFMHTQCCVETNVAAKANFVRMQPARAVATRPVSIRSPLLKGLGKVTFSYQGADENAEIWVQVATNQVNGNTIGTGNYNESIKSVELGETEPIGTWITIAKYKYGATGAEGYKPLGTEGAVSEYLGWHCHPHRPVHGMYRLFIPPAVVEKAGVVATNAQQYVDYGQLTVTKLTCTGEPGFSDASWRGWNMRTIGNPGSDKEEADIERRMNLVDMKIEDDGAGLVGALNNSANDVYERGAKVTTQSESWERLKASYPAIYSPAMKPSAKHTGSKRSGVGSVTFKARLYSTTGVPETAGGGMIWIYGSNDPTGSEETWTLLKTHDVVGSVFSNYTWTAGTELYTAVKLEVHNMMAQTDRIVLDEIVIGEKVPPTIGFEYARPFRNDLFTATEIKDILSPAEQPLAGESWGVQTKLTLQQLTDEIDIEKGFEVYLMHQRGKKPWGYGRWTAASEPVKLVQVGDASNLVFRSVGTSPKSLVEPAAKGGEIVQFMLKVKYYDRGGTSDEILLGSDWEQPDWFYPLDYNEENGGYEDEKNFAAYTVLDSVSPGRAWINEISWNDGTAAQNDDNDAITNQYVEICIPSGVDMTGWKLRMTDRNENAGIFAVFGEDDLPSKKVSAHAVNGYEFYVLQSPKTKEAGGIRYPGEKVPAADGTWYETSLGTSTSGGTLKFSSPYQFELVRPSGIIEHQLVADGTNTYARYPDWRGPYDGTNLVAKLAVGDLLNYGRVSPLRFYAGADVARKANGKTFASLGVTGGEASEETADWPGGSNTWTEAMGFTPGRINEGQKIPEGWFLPPNGTNSWVYFLIETDHMKQKVGDEESKSILAVVPQGKTTNVVYDVDAWYEATIKVNDAEREVGRRGEFQFTLSPTGTTLVTASAKPQSRLASEFGLDDENPYKDAVLRWLREKYPNASADDIRLAQFRGLQNLDDISWLSLTQMYWLDIPPVPMTSAEWQMNDGTNWWLRGGINKMGREHKVYRVQNEEVVTYKNKQLDVTLYISNACTQAKWAPDKLQGLGYESSTNYVGVWTSVTFKVKGNLDLSSSTNFMPFRIFTFQPESFSGAAGEPTWDPPLDPFTSRIDIMDPFQSPIGVNYGWDKYPSISAFFMWVIDDKQYPYTTEKLQTDSTYPETTE